MSYKCELCDQEFKYFDDLYWHYEIEHNIYENEKDNYDTKRRS